MSQHEEIEIVPATLEILCAEMSGVTVERLAGLIHRVFRDPPWNEDHQMPRIIFGLGAGMMRRNAMLYLARTTVSGRIAGYIMGHEVLRQREDSRDLTLGEIVGTDALDPLFDGGKRVFYVDGQGVATDFRRRCIAERLSLALIDELRRQGFNYRLGRTDITAGAMRSLFAKLGFRELRVLDAHYPTRSYWLLPLEPTA
ncbi:MAG TPA: GNAT family N-acetyltransferase [Methylococcaceae bacterium]|nr:GNAT family N-acetyltransferase [Methylococcaceae bacterium]